MEPTSNANIPKSPTLGNKPLPAIPVRGQQTPSTPGVRQSPVQSTDSVASELLTQGASHQPDVKTPHHRLGAINPETLRETEKFLVKTGKQVISQVKTGTQSVWKASKELIQKKSAKEDPVAQLNYAKKQLEDVETNTHKLEWNLKALNKQIDDTAGKFSLLVDNSYKLESDILTKKEHISEIDKEIQDINQQVKTIYAGLKGTDKEDRLALGVKREIRGLFDQRSALFAEKQTLLRNIKSDEGQLANIHHEMGEVDGLLKNLGNQQADLEKAINIGKSEIALINHFIHGK